MGFQQVTENDDTFLRCSNPALETVNSALSQVAAARARIDQLLLPKSTSFSQLTEKQKARLLHNQKLEREREEAQRMRKHTLSQIAADKDVRENDPNWKPSVSAAAQKSGDTMQSFRDKFGE